MQDSKWREQVEAAAHTFVLDHRESGWISTDEEQEATRLEFIDRKTRLMRWRIILRPDGKFHFHNNLVGSDGAIIGKWHVDGSRVFLDDARMESSPTRRLEDTRSMVFVVDGKTLVLDDPGPMTYRFERRSPDELAPDPFK